MKKNKTLIGSWMQTASAPNAEIISGFNFDWICFDLEHGELYLHDIPNLMRIFEKKKIKKFVRVKTIDEYICSKVIEFGIDGIIFSKIENSGQVLLIKKYCNYPPNGEKGVGFSRHNNYGDSVSWEIKNESLTLIGMIETKKGLKNINKILNNKVLDGVFIGPYDLSMSLGIPEKFNSPIFKKSLEKILNEVKKKKLICGIHEVSGKTNAINNRINEGFNFIGAGIDTIYLKNSLENLKKILQK